MFGQTRLGTTAVAAMAVVLAGLGIVEALDQFGASPVLPALFPLIPFAIVAFLGLRSRSLAFDDIARGGMPSSRGTAAAAAGAALPAVLLVAAPIGAALGGWRGLVPVAVFFAGLLVAWLLLVPGLRAEGAATLAEAIGRRFGRSARAAASVSVVLISFALLLAEASLAGLIGARMLGVPSEAGRDIVLAVAGFAALLGGLGAGISIAAILIPIVTISFLVPVGVVSLGEMRLPFPWIGLFDAAMLEAATRISPLVLGTLGLSLLVGVAAMPSLLFPAWSASPRQARRIDLTVAALLVLAVLLVAPSYAAYGRLAGIDATTDPAGLVLSFPDRVGLSAAPSVLLIGGLLAAALTALTMHLATAAATIGHDLYGPFAERRTPEGRQLFIGRLAMILLALAASFVLRRTETGGIATYAGIGLSLSAATLAPILLFGRWIRHLRALAGTGAMLLGLWLTLADIGVARFAPKAGRYLGMGTVTDTVLGPTGWFGLPIGLSGVIGFASGIIALFALSWLPRQPWRLYWIHIRLLGRHLHRRWRAWRRPAPPIAIAPEIVSQPAPVLALPPPEAKPESLPVAAAPASNATAAESAATVEPPANAPASQTTPA